MTALLDGVQLDTKFLTFRPFFGPALSVSASAKFMLLLQYPVLETPGGAIRESVAICRYVASLGAGALYPAAVTPAADIRSQIDAWIDWSHGVSLVLRVMWHMSSAIALQCHTLAQT
jgi:glutathione S-transferase